MAERHYVPAAEVAKACGLSVYEIDTQCRPADWATPRDFICLRDGSLSIAVASLHRLADAIQARGHIDAALVLRSWANKLPPPRFSVAEDRVVPVQRELVPPETDELNRAMPARAHASDRESATFDWEQE